MSTTAQFIQQVLIINGCEPIEEKRVRREHLTYTEIIIEATYRLGISGLPETWEYIFVEWHMPLIPFTDFETWLDKHYQKRKIG